jgi:pimeloyl-ACP methyl ester carboxylesterase
VSEVAAEPRSAPADAGRAQAFYLALEPDPVFAVAHPPAGVASSRTGVLFCPAFGWDELCSHRSLLRWAESVAADGHTALRVDLPGSGDSGGRPRDPQRIAAWTEALHAGANWLHVNAECDRVVAIGIGLGGMLAIRALAAGAPIDELVLWSVPARGNTLVRELRAFAQMAAGEAADSAAQQPPAIDDGSLEVAGFVLSAQTLAELAELDLTKLELPHTVPRRVLLMGRDAIAADRRLRERLQATGAEITVADGVGYGAMMTHPQLAETPRETITLVSSWLEHPGGEVGDEREPRVSSVPTTAEVLLTSADATVRETPFAVDLDGQRLHGVLTQPASQPAGLCVVLMNAGSVRRIGPNRMWVECARRWAAAGVTTLRLDGSGLGDSDGDERPYQRSAHFYRTEMAEQVLAALDELEMRGLPSRFLVGGLCSGAYWGFHAALRDERVRGLVLINIWTFFWSEQRAAAHDMRRARTLLRTGAWRELAQIATSEGRLGRLARAKLRTVLRRREAAPLEPGAAIDAALERLGGRGVETLLLLSEGEALADELTRLGRIDSIGNSPNLSFERIPIKDHIFRPVWAQQHVHRRLDAAIARVVEGIDQHG